MTRKSKARFGMSRTYKLTPAAKALRAALFAGVAVAAVAPSAQAACVVVGNSVTCTGIFNSTVNNGDEWTVVTPADLASIVFDSNSDISVFNSQFGVNASNAGGISAINDGDITVYNQLSFAVGFSISSPNGDVEAENNGSISAISTGSYARGILASSTNGDVTVSNTGSIYASGANSSIGAFASTTNGDITAYNSGDVTAYSGNGIANGFRLITTTGNIDFTSNGGSITAQSDLSQAVGISAVTTNGNVAINNSSDILADSGAASSTYGIFARANSSGDVSVVNDAYVHAIAVNGASTGIISISNNFSAYVGGSGDVTAESINGAAIGVRALALNNGFADIVVSGDITASSVSRSATGILANGGAGAYINSSGAISATTTTGSAIGIQADSINDIDVFNYGDILAQTTTGFVRGIQAQATGFLAEVSVDNSGDITASSVTGGSAQGIRATSSRGYTSVTNSGAISASSTYSNALSIVAVGRYGVDVINSGDLSASTGAAAYGIYAYTRFYDAYVYNAGDITALSTNSSTSGIYAKGGDYAVIVNKGDITVTADIGNAYGAYAYAVNNSAIIANYADIDINALGDATGHFAKSLEGSAYVYNFGDVDVSSQNGIAYGLYASAITVYDGLDQNALIYNTGDVSASSQYSDASAIVALANNDITVYNTGLLTAGSLNGDAIGIVAVTNSGIAQVVNNGDISATSKYGNAYGIYAMNSLGDTTINNTGDLRATGYDARGISVNTDAYDSDITISNSLNTIVASASANGEAYGIYAYSDGAGDVSISSNGVINATGGDAFGIYAATDNDDSYYSESGVYFAGGNIGISLGSASNITATSNNFGSYGEYAYSGGDAYGVYARVEEAYGDITISNAGRISATANGLYSTAAAISANGYGSIGINTTATSVINVTANAGYAYGIRATSEYGNIDVSNLGAITVSGDYAYGMQADTSAYRDISISNSTTGRITVSGDYTAYGLDLDGARAVVSNSGNIVASSASGTAIAIKTRTDSDTLIHNSGLIDANGSDAWAIVSSTTAGSVGITNNASGIIDGAIVTGSGVDSFVNVGKWFVGNSNVSNFGDGGDVINNVVGGKIYMDDSSINMGAAGGFTVNGFINNGKLYANNDNLINMGSTAWVFTNNGSSIHMNDGVVNDSLTIVGSFAGTGRIYVDANGTSMLADRLYIQGDVVTNTANVIDVFLAGQPSLADIVDGEEIDIVSVTGVSTAANFNLGIVTLNDDELFAYSAQLNKRMNFSGTNDLFSLGFTLDGLSGTGIAASSVTPGVQALWNQGMGTLFQREGSRREYKETGNGGYVADYKGGAGAWLRGFSGNGGMSPDASNNNFGAADNHNFDYDGSGIEFGLGYAFNNSWTFGLLGGTSDSTLKPDAGGRVKIDGSTFGGYLTYTPGNGFYADLSYRSMDFDGNGNGGSNDFGFEGKADGYSLELGYGYKTASGLVVEPQFQYSMVDVDLDTISYTNYDFVSTDGDSTQMRLGVALRKSFKTAKGNYWTPYGSLSYLDESDGANSYSIGGLLEGDVDTGGGSTLLEVGATGRIAGVGISAGINWRDGGAYDSVVGGQASIRYDW